MNVNDWFETLQHDYIEQEGTRLLCLEQEWRDRVPQQMDRAAQSTIEDARSRAMAGLPMLLAPTLIRPKKALAPLAVRTAAVGIVAAAAVSAGAYVVSPAVRETVGTMFAGSTAPVVEQTRTPAHSVPTDYVIPLPGEGYAVSDEVEGNRVRYVWFKNGSREVLVEILFYQPEDTTGGRAEPVTVGSLSGTYSELNGKTSVILEDGGTWLVVQCSDLERAETMAYAEALVEANGK